MGDEQHIAFSDEAYYTAHRFRGIAVLTLPESKQNDIRVDLLNDLSSSNVDEFEWKNLSSARERFATIKFIDTLIKYAILNIVRMDILIWDTHDNRHDIPGRDDIQNLERMYYHLFKSVLKFRWPEGAKWNLYPDQNSALDWSTMHEFLELSSSSHKPQTPIPQLSPQSSQFIRDFNILGVDEISSSESPEVQLCDLFAGIGVYTYANYQTYESWCRSQSGQISLPLSGEDDVSLTEFSGSEEERCEAIYHLNYRCKDNKLRVGLKTTRGFQTHDPRLPINFWFYSPQHENDKAPVRN